jgi:hypothetical protein
VYRYNRCLIETTESLQLSLRAAVHGTSAHSRTPGGEPSGLPPDRLRRLVLVLAILLVCALFLSLFSI